MSNLNQNTLSDIAASFKVLNKQISSFQKTIKFGLTDLTAELKKTKENINISLKQLSSGIKQLSSIKQQIHVVVTNRPNINLNVNIENGGSEGTDKEGFSSWEIFLAGIDAFNKIVGTLDNIGKVRKWFNGKFGKPQNPKPTGYKYSYQGKNGQLGHPPNQSQKSDNQKASTSGKTSPNKPVKSERVDTGRKPSTAPSSVSSQTSNNNVSQKDVKLTADKNSPTKREAAEAKRQEVATKKAEQTAKRHVEQTSKLTQDNAKPIKITADKGRFNKGGVGRKVGKVGKAAGLIALFTAATSGIANAMSPSENEQNESTHSANGQPQEEGFFSKALSFGSSLLSSPVVRTLGRVGLTGVRIARMATPLGWASLAAEAALSSDFVQDKISSFFSGSDNQKDPELIKMDLGEMSKYVEVTPPNVSPNAAVGMSPTTNYNIHNKPIITINVAPGTSSDIISSVKNGVQQGLNTEQVMTRVVNGGLA